MLAKALILAFAVLSLFNWTESANHYPKYSFNVPGGYVNSMGHHKGVTLGYAFPGSTQGGPPAAKVYQAIGHTHGIDGDLPDVFLSSDIRSNFFTLKATGGGFINFLEDVSIDPDYLQGIIMDNQITLQMVEQQFGPGVEVRVSAFLDFLRSRGIQAQITTVTGPVAQIIQRPAQPVIPVNQGQVIQVIDSPRPRPPTVSLDIPSRPALPVLPPAARPPTPVIGLIQSDAPVQRPQTRPTSDQRPQTRPTFPRETFEVVGGSIVVIIDDNSRDITLVRRVIQQSQISLQDIESQFGAATEISLRQLIRWMESIGITFVIFEGPQFLDDNRRVRLQLLDGEYIIIMNDGYILNFDYLQQVIRDNRLDRNKLGFLLSSGRDITSREFADYLRQRLNIILDPQYILVELQLPTPVQSWIVYLVDRDANNELHRVSLLDDASGRVNFQDLQRRVFAKGIDRARVLATFRTVSLIKTTEFSAWVESLPDSQQSNGGGNIFVARFPATGVREEIIRVPVSQQVEQISFTNTQQQGGSINVNEESNEQEVTLATPAPPIATTFRPFVPPTPLIPVVSQPAVLVQPAGGFVQQQFGGFIQQPGGFVQTEVRPGFSGGAWQQLSGGQGQFQRVTFQRPAQRIRVISRPAVQVNEIVEQVRIPQQQIRVFQTQPQVFVTRTDSSGNSITTQEGSDEEDRRVQSLGTSGVSALLSNQVSGSNTITLQNEAQQTGSSDLDDSREQQSISSGHSSSNGHSSSGHSSSSSGSVRTSTSTFQLQQPTVTRVSVQEQSLSQDSGEEVKVQRISGPRVVSRIVVPTQQRTILVNNGSTKIISSQRSSDDVRGSRGYLARFRATGSAPADSREN